MESLSIDEGGFMHQPRAIVFVDADNQSPVLGSLLLRFLASIGRDDVQCFIAGNGSGDRVNAWRASLEDTKPDVQVVAHVTPLRKQSADVRLVFEMATLYHSQPDPQTVILVVSRDDLLLAAAESLHVLGHHVLIVLGGSATTVPLATELPVLVLPLPQPPAQPLPKEEAPPVTVEPQSPQVAEAVDSRVVSATISKIRQTLVQSKGGGYAASAVGHLLSQMGYDREMRTRILQSIPNLREAVVGADKILFF
ncbi:NYN domain-containing protein [Thauera sp.]|uniref:NYN domain-containing protein n=1 Tax=Thauera sp. TaxID=1905334 RepID=UPI0039E7154A